MTKSLFFSFLLFVACTTSVFAQGADATAANPCTGCIAVSHVGSSSTPIALPQVGANADLDAFVVAQASALTRNAAGEVQQLVKYHQIQFFGYHYLLVSELRSSKGKNIGFAIALEQAGRELRVNPGKLHDLANEPSGVPATRFACYTGPKSDQIGNCRIVLNMQELGLECRCDAGNITALATDAKLKAE